MNSLLKWILKNSWNLFGAIGVAGTFYFSLMYVPDYVKDITTSKINVIHESLMDDLQEVIFHGREVTISDIETFIRGKELKQGAVYPYTSEELLVQVQERFMSNKFIPLEKRGELLDTINTIRSQYKPPTEPISAKTDWISILSILLSGFGALIAGIGAASLVAKFKSDKETEADIMSGDIIVNHHGSASIAGFEYEKMVGEILKELGVLSATNVDGYDFIVESAQKQMVVEVKRYRKLLGLGTAREFLHKVVESEKGGILVVSSGVTQRSKELITEHNKISGNQKVYIVTGDSRDEIKDQLNKVFNG
ncbi:restriction endonuclease [Vibrio metschnikovii]|uniref:restriction endonuclease n=1 Tax=Vibrio metschnikovii TaxID=28172 RepID=UPI001C2FD7E3|nr:restriction endonuclease [Vibrio metschnikovii]MDA3140361.1 restriction endonuclease [Vibrio metschnikovii]